MNSDIIRVPFEAHHWDFIEPDPRVAGLKASMNLQAVLDWGRGVSWIDRTSGEVLAMGGYILRREGVAWLWFLPSARGSRMLLRFLRVWRQWEATLDAGVRLEAHVLASFNEGCRWAEMVGLKRENAVPIECWDGTNDYHLYARVIGDDDETV